MRLQEEMPASPEVMALILSLQNDRDVQRVLADPEIVEAIGVGDIYGLMVGSAFMRIMEEQAVRNIGRKPDR